MAILKDGIIDTEVVSLWGTKKLKKRIAQNTKDLRNLFSEVQQEFKQRDHIHQSPLKFGITRLSSWSLKIEPYKPFKKKCQRHPDWDWYEQEPKTTRCPDCKRKLVLEIQRTKCLSGGWRTNHIIFCSGYYGPHPKKCGYMYEIGDS